MKFHSKIVSLLVAAITASIMVGCGGGPATGTVTGLVTLDDKPIPNANVTFYPEDGRASMGTTDSEGKYELVFTRDKKGALIGTHKVTITTEVLEVSDYGADDDYDQEESDVSSPSGDSNSRAEMLPAKYRDFESTELTASIAKGANVVDFLLTSD